MGLRYIVREIERNTFLRQLVIRVINTKPTEWYTGDQDRQRQVVCDGGEGEIDRDIEIGEERGE